MKTLLRKRFVLLLIALTALLTFGAFAAPHSFGNGQIEIKRAANFGINLSLVVYIDGRSAGALGVGNSFLATVPAGRHEVTAWVPQRRTTSVPALVTLVVQPGQTHRLTAGFHGQDLVLR